MSDVSETKIAGFIPKSKFVTITYYLILASMVIGAINVLMVMNATFSGLVVLGSIAGLSGLLMGLGGFFLFKDELVGLDRNHLAYICILFAVCFVVNAIFNAIFLATPGLLLIVNLVLYAAEIVLFYTGLNSYKKARSISKENIKDEVQLALKRA